MRWTQATPSYAIWTVEQLAYPLRIDDDVISDQREADYLNDLQAAAVEYAETAMGTSLLPRTITALYYPQDAGTSVCDPISHGLGTIGALRLPHGPIISITSVTDAHGNTPQWKVDGFGYEDRIIIRQQWAAPLTVVYQAGYADAAHIPPDIKAAIRMHVGTLYQNRESVSDKEKLTVPHSLEAFYQRKSRNCLIG